MKAFTIILKILAALAAIAGIVYIVATYGDKIVAWSKKMLGICKGCCEGDVIIEETAEETVVEEVPAEEGAVQAPEAAETDFEA